MNYVTTALVNGRLDDLRRAAENSRNVTAARDAARHAAPASPSAVTIRIATPGDVPALKRLAELDSSEVPAGPVLLAEIGRELHAGVSLSDRAIIADPFHPAAAYVDLSLARPEQLLGGRPPRLRRLRERSDERTGPGVEARPLQRAAVERIEQHDARTGPSRSRWGRGRAAGGAPRVRSPARPGSRRVPSSLRLR